MAATTCFGTVFGLYLPQLSGCGCHSLRAMALVQSSGCCGCHPSGCGFGTVFGLHDNHVHASAASQIGSNGTLESYIKRDKDDDEEDDDDEHRDGADDDDDDDLT